MIVLKKYNGPPCREHCGFDGPLKNVKEFATIESGIQYILSELMDEEYDNYILCKDDKNVFSYPWSMELPSSKNTLLFDDFLLQFDYKENDTKNLINKHLPQISKACIIEDDEYL